MKDNFPKEPIIPHQNYSVLKCRISLNGRCHIGGRHHTEHSLNVQTHSLNLSYSTLVNNMIAVRYHMLQCFQLTI